MKNLDLDNVVFDFKGAYIETDTEIQLFLRRQGVSKTLNCAHPLFFVEIDVNATNGFNHADVHYSNDFNIYKGNAGQIYKSGHHISGNKSAIQYIERYASELSGKKVTVLDETLSYMYGWKSYSYQDNDVLLSPTFYCEYSDTIRLLPSNQCLIAFDGGDFGKPVFDVDKAAIKFNRYVEKAIKTGFHDCDRKKGADYCKRRLAWLTGAFISKDNNGARFVNQNMTLVK